MKIFCLEENKTTVKTEVLAGLTTFTAMVYILIVNPAILSISGMPAEAILGATIISSALMTLSMAFFTYTLCLGVGMSWQAALGLVFYSGVLFLILTLSGIRKKILIFTTVLGI